MLLKRLLALLMLLCFGMVTPLAATPVRICLLESKDRKPDCCRKCQSEPVDHKDCCAKIDKAPDSPLPGGALALPAFIPVEIPLLEFQAVAVYPAPVFMPGFAYPIRGPDLSPAAQRSVLNIWRI